MSRFERAYIVPGYPETRGATIESAKELAALREECILLQEPLTENIVRQIGAKGEYLCYTDTFIALRRLYMAEDPPKHSLSQDQIDSAATKAWKRYILFLRPDLSALIEEFNHSMGYVDPNAPHQHIIPGKWFSRSLVYRTIIGREGLEELQLSKDLRRKLGKQTVATLDALLSIAPSETGQVPI